jgi:hypothetical protein
LDPRQFIIHLYQSIEDYFIGTENNNPDIGSIFEGKSNAIHQFNLAMSKEHFGLQLRQATKAA